MFNFENQDNSMAGLYSQVVATPGEDTLRAIILEVKTRIAGARLFEGENVDKLAVIDEVARPIIADYNSGASSAGKTLLSMDLEQAVQHIADAIIGWGPLAELMKDSRVEDIAINGPDDVWVTYAGQPGWFKVDAAFEGWDDILQLIHNKTDGRVAKPLNEANPFIDAQLPDGSRLHAIMAPLTVVPGPICTIRRFRAVASTLGDLVSLGHSSQAAVNFLRALVKARRSLVVIGGTASGKTTFIQACLSECEPQERIVTCEDTPELKVPAPLWSSLVTKDAVTADRHDAVDMANLVRQNLRMRPDRIIIGEVRDGAMGAVLQAGNTGHNGIMFTVHANDPQAAIQRMETLALMYPPMATLRELHIRRMITTALHYIVHVGQVLQADGKRARKLLAISEIRGVQGEDVYMEDIFLYNPKEDEWCRRTGLARFNKVYPQLDEIHSACPAFDFRRDVVETEARL